MLRRRSIRLRILILVLVPVVALIGLYAVVLNLTLGSYLTLRQATTVQKQITTPVSNLQAQLIIERALAMQYMAYPEQSRLTLLEYQEHRTDLVRAAFLTAAAAADSNANTPEMNAIGVWRADMATLNQLRTSVANLSVSRLNALKAYSSTISDGDTVTNQAILPLVTGTVGIQANDIIDMERAAQTIAEESDLLSSDLIAHSFSAADLQLFGQLVALHQEIWNQTLPALDPSYQTYFRTLIPARAASRLTAMESDVVINGARAKVSLPAWISTVRAYSAGLQAALVKSGATLQTTAESQASVNGLRLILTGGLGLLAILAAVAVGIVVSRGLVRQLNDLRLSALDLSGHRLPSTIQRLRAGEDIDVEAEVPEFEPGPDEIGQVRRAFNTVQRTAIAAAVDENRIRRGVNDVFRNLARRNQSLLTRQLQLLDAMERRIDEPEELADLFRIDHLTTRMRRHAEGLLIVAGDSSGRSWREPVPIVDVMRAAIAEVEDYTRIRVMSRSGAALAGHAVADVIHLLAELLENATMFSPANTPVRVDGDMVARGLAVEIEDRGLGMGEDQLEEINRKLADPPLFDLSGSDQLGLFIAGQLAKRHDIRITLRSSAFGGTTAVVLIPRSLVIYAEGGAEALAAAGVRELGGRPIPQLLAAVPGTEYGGIVQGSASVGAETGNHRLQSAPEPSIAARVMDLVNSVTAQDANPVTAVQPSSGSTSRPFQDASPWSTTPPSPTGTSQPFQDASPWSTTPPSPTGTSQPFQDASPWSTTPPSPTGTSQPFQDASPWSTTPPSPTGTSQPFQDTSAWSIAPPSSPSSPSPTGTAQPFQDVSAWSTAPPGPERTSQPFEDVSAWSTARPSPGPRAGSWPDGDRPVLPTRRPAAQTPVTGGNGGPFLPPVSGPAVPPVQGDPGDLPVRVRQASLAPQLRDQFKPAPSDPDDSATEFSPEAARSTMAALQHGWERGRSVPVGPADEGLEPSAEPSASDGSTQTPAQQTGGDSS